MRIWKWIKRMFRRKTPEEELADTIYHLIPIVIMTACITSIVKGLAKKNERKSKRRN
jgi:hypothetical protein